MEDVEAFVEDLIRALKAQASFLFSLQLNTEVTGTAHVDVVMRLIRLQEEIDQFERMLESA